LSVFSFQGFLLSKARTASHLQSCRDSSTRALKPRLFPNDKPNLELSLENRSLPFVLYLESVDPFRFELTFGFVVGAIDGGMHKVIPERMLAVRIIARQALLKCIEVDLLASVLDG
jgi:hypothetical protein